MVEVAAAGTEGLQQSFRLLNEHLQFDDDTRGELKLLLKWIFDPSISRSIAAGAASSVSMCKQSLMNRARRMYRYYLFYVKFCSVRSKFCAFECPIE